MGIELFDEGRIRLTVDDCRRMLAALDDDTADACVTDPPYELGFMDCDWDGTGIAYDTVFWRDVLRVLKPGAHALVFTAARTYHRVACAMEDAGFDIRDQIDWVYASGMPHGRDLGDGWHTLLKPAHEPIVVARKPGATGGLHVDACRIPARPDEQTTDGEVVRAGRKTTGIYGEYSYSTIALPSSTGRFPPNMLFDDVMAGELDRQSGRTVSRAGKPREARTHGEGWGMTHTGAEYDDEGGVSRMFPVFRYEPKAAQAERPRVDGIAHPTVKPLALMRWLVRLACPVDGLVLEPFAGSGATLEACRSEGMRCEAAEQGPDYATLIRKRLDKPHSLPML